ncbi:MAG: mCpol domain-containing protein [Candidatus Electrothrix sp. GW3-4]|uniref:mCpol domain-containing protein n=1 Tax=Candidatus Electrothrix sp. GW3-4 TaxID=3126740 RepID=UPI0030CF4942
MNKSYIAIDGDDVGLHLRTFIINEEIENVSNFSNELDIYFKKISRLLSLNGYNIVFCGGDSVLAYIEKDKMGNVIELLPVGVCTISVGISNSAEKAYLALQLAKARGKAQVVTLTNAEATTIKIWGQ